MDNTDTYMLVNDHAETTNLSGLTHVRYDMTNAFRLAHKEVKANTEQRKVANQVGIPRTGINDNKQTVESFVNDLANVDPRGGQQQEAYDT